MNMSFLQLTKNEGFIRQNPTMPGRGGFTLIEVFIVATIIAIISAIVISQLNEARTKSVDSVRVSDLKQIRNALELYREQNDAYPIISAGVLSTDAGWRTSLGSELGPYINLPIDPINLPAIEPFKGGHVYWYISDNEGKSYDLTALLEIENQNSCPKKSWTSHVYGGGGSNWCELGVTFGGIYVIADH